MTKQFGGKFTRELEQRYSQSTQWQDKKFMNIEETEMDISPLQIPKLLYKQFFEKAGREPNEKLAVLPFDKNTFISPSEKIKFIWYGHSVVLMRMANKTILIDPMLGPNAAPISPFAIKRFSENILDLIQDFPEIDLLLLTHDHYDHLDFDSIALLAPSVKQYFVALGCSRHLEKWGIQKEKIKEFDWWDTVGFDSVKITFTPTRHFSGRGLTDRAKSLWGGWVLKTATENVYFSGDSGYGEHFKEVGERLGPFDFAFMECGQYNENWSQIHMFPEEAIKAAQDALAKTIMPVHWAGFALAQHHWTDPIVRFISEAENQNMTYIHPKLGEIVKYHGYNNTRWWEME
ncbi:MBL fold metallo-hydrolase [Maribacter sp.]|nr:MBL fold metallo-hydrolase [Maribacter sp.]